MGRERENSQNNSAALSRISAILWCRRANSWNCLRRRSRLRKVCAYQGGSWKFMDRETGEVNTCTRADPVFFTDSSLFHPVIFVDWVHQRRPFWQIPTVTLSTIRKKPPDIPTGTGPGSLVIGPDLGKDSSRTTILPNSLDMIHKKFYFC